MAATSSKAVQKSRAEFLVVCGAISKKDEWLFGNFVGICITLMTLEVAGEFWSAFPVGEYFQTHDNIKFGREDGSWKALEIYTRKRYENRERFWRQCDGEEQERLAERVIRQVDRMSQTLAANDSLTIILIAHGSTQGLKMGTKTLYYSQLANVLLRFRPRVQVNVVIQACHSEAFADLLSVQGQPARFTHTSCNADQRSYSDVRSPSGRFRNSCFSSAFLQEPRICVRQGHKLLDPRGTYHARVSGG